MNPRFLVASLVLAIVAAVALTPFARRMLSEGFAGADRAPHANLREPSADVPGWTGERVFADGSRVVVLLTRLHSDPDRQAFDARVLARRGDVRDVPGATGEDARAATESDPRAREPFLCRVTWRAAARAGGDASEPARLEIARLEVRDVRGPALAAPPPLERRASDAVADPLDVLSSAPTRALERDETIAVLLIGRAPGADAHVTLGEGVRVDLVEAHLPNEGLDRALARVGGKNEPPAGVEGTTR